MSKPNTLRKYGRQNKKPRSDRLFVELPQTPIRRTRQSVAAEEAAAKDEVTKLTENLSAIKLQDEGDEENTEPEPEPEPEPEEPRYASSRRTRQPVPSESPGDNKPRRTRRTAQAPTPPDSDTPGPGDTEETHPTEVDPGAQQPQPQPQPQQQRVLSWAEVCPPGDRIVKIAEASYAEVYRVTNARGTSVVKVIRLASPLRAQTAAQARSGLVDEAPHSAADVAGELRISEWLADVPGFVVYKERYEVRGGLGGPGGGNCRALLETHRVFQRRAQRRDPGRAQFYPSPARYLDGTRFLAVELGDAGVALEDFALVAADQLWDIFFHVAIALARAEARIEFEHRDLHEGNVCIRQVSDPVDPADRAHGPRRFGYSGLEITILDYGLSRASPPPRAAAAAATAGEGGGQEEEEEGGEDGAAAAADERAVAYYDLERDLSLFTSEHAPQCRVYRQMRSFLLRGDRVCLPPARHGRAYEETCATGADGDGGGGAPLSWAVHEPYTNVLWLAYLYDWMTGGKGAGAQHFGGPRAQLAAFRRPTAELWRHLDPDAAPGVPGFDSASDVVRYAVEAGWVDPDQLTGGRGGGGGGGGGGDDVVERSILSAVAADDGGAAAEGADRSPLVRRSPRRRARPSAPA
ncbi:hypothetical protein GGR56DRAFT_671586 [Xylariaceae sp. FL0804]|nr:hypothetical protein GGR56DRAFT_671586 [Xylariaceae sp. FL0804]